MKKHKTILAGIIGISLFILPLAASADFFGGFDPGWGNDNLLDIIASVINILMGLLGVLAVLLFLYGGFTWMIAAGNPDKVETAKKIILAAVIGLIIIFLSWALAQFIVGTLSNATGVSV